MKTRSLTTEEKARIVGMHQAGVKGAQIGRELGLAKQTVHDVLKRFKKRGTVESPKPTGRPPKLTERDKRSLGRLLVQDRRAPLSEITNQLATDAHIDTVRKAAHKLGFNSRVATRKPFLSDRHLANRLAFAKKYEKWTVADWKRVIWTDESTFEIGKISRRVLVWRREDEKFKNVCLAPVFKSGRTSVMIWGAFVADQKLPLVFMPAGRRTAVDFVEIVYNGVLGPWLSTQENPANLVLMEDGAPVHRSNAPKAWRESRSLVKLEWPANSPDLNPIENVWRLLKDEVQCCNRPKNVEQMKIALEAAWQGISAEKLESLVSSMPERIKAVLKAKGGATRW